MAAWRVEKLKPLAWLPSGTLLADYCGTLYDYDPDSGGKRMLYRLPGARLWGMLGSISLIARMLRLGVRYALALADGGILLVYDRKFFYCRQGVPPKCIGPVPAGSRPLNMVELVDMPGFESGVYYGEYPSSFERHAVAIRKIDPDRGDQGAVYTFPEGRIGHIHNLIPDRKRNAVWVLTGDFGTAAGIWLARDGFRSMEPIAIGSQNCRACWAVPTAEGLLYATDSQHEFNSVRLLEPLAGKWVSRSLCEVSGPVIYGCGIGDEYVLSTSVEGSVTAGQKWRRYWSRRRGHGVKDGYIHFYRGTSAGGFKEFYRQKKDFLPFIPFQFGCAVLPGGNNKTGWLCWHQVATTANDMKMILVDLKKPDPFEKKCGAMR